jgi:hypothetical protein
MVRLLTIPFFVFLILFSLAWLALSLFVMRRSLGSRSWPRTVGTVVSTEVKRTLTGGVPVDSVSYEPCVTYTYSVRGRQYQHDKLTAAVTPGIREPAGAAAIVAKYPVGRQVTVFYNPADHGDAVLVAGGSSGNWYFVLFGGALLAAAVIGLISQWPR